MTIESANFVRETRERLGMTQAAFADSLGVATRTVIRWEQGHTTPTKRDYLAIRTLMKQPANTKGR